MMSVRTKSLKHTQEFVTTWQGSAYQTKTKLTFSSRNHSTTKLGINNNLPHTTLQKWMATISSRISFTFAPNFNDVASVWRADTRPFNVIVGKGEGFKPRGTHDDIIKHVEGMPGNFVPFGATSQASKQFVPGRGWMYATNFPEVHLDVEETVGDEMVSQELFENSFAAKESEIVGIGEMPSEDVQMGRAIIKIPGTPLGAFVGELQTNEKWQPRNWTVQVHGINPFEILKREETARKSGKLKDDQRFIRIEEATEIAMGIKKEFSHYVITPNSPMCFIGSVKLNATFQSSITFAMESYSAHLKKHDVQSSKIFVSFAEITSTIVPTFYTADYAIKIIEANQTARKSAPVSSEVVSIEEVTESEAEKIEGKQKHQGIACVLDEPEQLPKGIITRQGMFAKTARVAQENANTVVVVNDKRHTA